MYPMDYEEFLWAIGDEVTADTIRLLLTKKNLREMHCIEIL